MSFIIRKISQQHVKATKNTFLLLEWVFRFSIHVLLRGEVSEALRFMSQSYVWRLKLQLVGNDGLSLLSFGLLCYISFLCHLTCFQVADCHTCSSVLLLHSTYIFVSCTISLNSSSRACFLLHQFISEDLTLIWSFVCWVTPNSFHIVCITNAFKNMSLNCELTCSAIEN